MFTKDGKEYRNLEEQVLKNMQDIQELRDVNIVLEAFGIKIVGNVALATDLPNPLTYGGNYGDAYTVGTVQPFNLYVFTRPNSQNPFPSWFNLGPFPLPGPQGIQGIQGPAGPQGVRGTKWWKGSGFPAVEPKYNLGDYYMDIATGTYYEYDGAAWIRVATLIGPQGPQGPAGQRGLQGEQGPQGPQGSQGPAGQSFVIVGTLTSIDQLPTPTLENRGEAYFVEIEGVNHLFVIIGTTELTWFDAGPIEGIQGEQGPQGEQGVAGPTGATGATGPQGVSVQSINLSSGTPAANGTLYSMNITLTNGTIQTVQFVAPTGPQGPAGQTVDTYTKTETNNLLSQKQNTLISGINIKTVGGQPLLGAGDIPISGGTGGENYYIHFSSTDGSTWNLENTNITDFENQWKESVLYLSIGGIIYFVLQALCIGSIIGLDANSKVYGVNIYADTSLGVQNNYTLCYLKYENNQYNITPIFGGITVQEKLVSGTNIKTINDQSILGSGNIKIESEEYIINVDSDSNFSSFTLRDTNITDMSTQYAKSKLNIYINDNLFVIGFPNYNTKIIGFGDLYPYSAILNVDNVNASVNTMLVETTNNIPSSFSMVGVDIVTSPLFYEKLAEKSRLINGESIAQSGNLPANIILFKNIIGSLSTGVFSIDGTSYNLSSSETDRQNFINALNAAKTQNYQFYVILDNGERRSIVEQISTTTVTFYAHYPDYTYRVSITASSLYTEQMYVDYMHSIYIRGAEQSAPPMNLYLDIISKVNTAYTIEGISAGYYNARGKIEINGTVYDIVGINIPGQENQVDIRYTSGTSDEITGTYGVQVVRDSVVEIF